MATIKVTITEPLLDGMDIRFKAPCNCDTVESLTVVYREDNESKSKVFTFRDAHCNNLTGLGNLFAAGAYIKVLLDTTNGYAYIQNADTNAYIEGLIGDIGTILDTINGEVV
jgi:hypothetical protein